MLDAVGTRERSFCQTLQRAIAAPCDDQGVVRSSTQKPKRPPLALIDAVVGDRDAVAVFLDQTNRKTVRLRPWKNYPGVFN